MWATSLPCDLLLDIFRRLGSTSVIRCAGVCKPWRHAIIDNASCLRPRPDRFLPDLLVGFLDSRWHIRTLGYLEDVRPACARSMLAMESVEDVGPYDRLLAMRDGFILFDVRGSTYRSSRLLLCNLIAGSRTFLPGAALGTTHWLSSYSYVLITAYDDDFAGGSSDVRILAAVGTGNGMTYRVFSTVSGVWGPVRHSAKLIDEDIEDMCVLQDPRSAVVCRGSIVYWLVMLLFDEKDDEDGSSDRHCMFAMDMRTERTWTKEVPEECKNPSEYVLATSEDSRQLYLVVAPESRINVWVLEVDDSRWTLQRTIDMQFRPILPPHLLCRDHIWLHFFCPRSGYMFVDAKNFWGVQQQFLVSVDGTASRQVEEPVGSESCFLVPYEMDWSTYVSKMKNF